MQKQKAYKYLAETLHLMFHPLLMPFFAVLILFNSNHFIGILDSEINHNYSLSVASSFYFVLLWINIFIKKLREK